MQVVAITVEQAVHASMVAERLARLSIEPSTSYTTNATPPASAPHDHLPTPASASATPPASAPHSKPTPSPSAPPSGRSSPALPAAFTEHLGPTGKPLVAPAKHLRRTIAGHLPECPSCLRAPAMRKRALEGGRSASRPPVKLPDPEWNSWLSRSPVPSLCGVTEMPDGQAGRGGDTPPAGGAGVAGGARSSGGALSPVATDVLPLAAKPIPRKSIPVSVMRPAFPSLRPGAPMAHTAAVKRPPMSALWHDVLGAPAGMAWQHSASPLLGCEAGNEGAGGAYMSGSSSEDDTDPLDNVKACRSALPPNKHPDPSAGGGAAGAPSSHEVQRFPSSLGLAPGVSPALPPLPRVRRKAELPDLPPDPPKRAEGARSMSCPPPTSWQPVWQDCSQPMYVAHREHDSDPYGHALGAASTTASPIPFNLPSHAERAAPVLSRASSTLPVLKNANSFARKARRRAARKAAFDNDGWATAWSSEEGDDEACGRGLEDMRLAVLNSH